MTDIGKVKIRLPSGIKPGDVVRARVLVLHPMEIIERKAGKPVDKHYPFINRVIVSYAGREIGQFELTQSVSENHSFSFAFRASEPGQLKVTFLDTPSCRYECTAAFKFS